MRPIPRSLLIHSAVLRRNSGVDKWQQPTFDDIMLSFVRLEPSNKIIVSKSNTEISLSSVLFYDCRLSRPLGLRFCVGDKITFDGAEYTVQTVEKLYDNSRLHHIEVGLI